jgi:predicted DNA-binding transcriptional regulator YafY
LDICQLSAEARRAILKKLLKDKPRFTVHDYCDACDGLVSIRQAQRDLAACEQIISRGQTRGKFYILKS